MLAETTSIVAPQWHDAEVGWCTTAQCGSGLGRNASGAHFCNAVTMAQCRSLTGDTFKCQPVSTCLWTSTDHKEFHETGRFVEIRKIMKLHKLSFFWFMPIATLKCSFPPERLTWCSSHEFQHFKRTSKIYSFYLHLAHVKEAASDSYGLLNLFYGSVNYVTVNYVTCLAHLLLFASRHVWM